jgi:DNA-directed RNA polymerase subunit E'/Rpb7
MDKPERPYVNTTLHTNVLLPADMLTSDLYQNLKDKLKKDVQYKSNKFGYISKVYRIRDGYQKDAIIPIEFFEASVRFNVTYDARLCSPQKGDIFPARIEEMIPKLIVAKEGPMRIYIKTEYINTEIFDINSDYSITVIKDKDRKLQVGDNIMVKVIKAVFLTNQNHIKIFASLENIYDKDIVAEV